MGDVDVVSRRLPHDLRNGNNQEQHERLQAGQKCNVSRDTAPPVRRSVQSEVHRNSIRQKKQRCDVTGNAAQPGNN
jgi:hypothetical protein